MNEVIKNVLNKIIDNKGEAYIVGGYVRDYILHKETYDVDIATSLLPNKLLELFPNATSNQYGGITFNVDDYSFDITTYRKELSYDNRRPIEIEYVNTIEEDSIRRDFTINSLYMDIDGNIIDIYNAKDDINNHIIRMVGNVNTRMIEDPLRILRVIRFKSILGFDIEESIITFIKQNKNLLSTLSYTRRKEELDYIINDHNRLIGLNTIKELGLEEVLEITIPDDIKDSDNSIVIWAQIKADKYPFTKNEINTINDIRNIVEYGIIDNTILYKYGIYAANLASDILNIDHAYISDVYKNMPIYSVKDIDLTSDDILDVLGVEPGSIIKDIYTDLENKILSLELDNNKEVLIKYIKDNWR